MICLAPLRCRNNEAASPESSVLLLAHWRVAHKSHHNHNAAMCPQRSSSHFHSSNLKSELFLAGISRLAADLLGSAVIGVKVMRVASIWVVLLAASLEAASEEAI